MCSLIKEMSFIEFMDDHYGDKDVLLLDVRDEALYVRGTIPGAVNLPMSKLRELFTLPKEKRVFVFCQSDEFSREVTELLTDEGYDATDLVGGYRQFLRDLAGGEFELPPRAAQ